MKRRAFLSLIGGAALAPAMLRPLAASAQQRERMRRIGVLVGLAATERDWRKRKQGFDAAAAAVILQDYLDR